MLLKLTKKTILAKKYNNLTPIPEFKGYYIVYENTMFIH